MKGRFNTLPPKVAGVHRFLVYVGDPRAEIMLGRFASVRGLKIEMELNDIREENQRISEYKPGNAKMGPIVFEKGLELNEGTLYDWIKKVQALYCESAFAYAKDLYIYVLDETLTKVHRILCLEKAWPYVYQWDDLDGLKSDVWREKATFMCKDILDVTP